MNSAPRNEPTFTLDTSSPTPWVHPDNLTTDMELAAAQRVGGILMTKLERSRNGDYDEALRLSGVRDTELTGIEASEESVVRIGAVIHELKLRVLESANPGSFGKRPATAVALA